MADAIPPLISDDRLLRMAQAIGRTLEVGQQGEQFLEVFCAETGVTGAGLWVAEGEGYSEAAAWPKGVALAAQLQFDIAFWSQFDSTGIFAASVQEASRVVERLSPGLLRGHIYAVALQDTALLAFWDAKHTAPFPSAWFSQMQPVWQHFEAALRNGLVFARTQAEQGQRADAVFEQLLNDLPIEVSVFDTEGRFLYANPCAVPDATVRRQLVGKNNSFASAQLGISDALAEKRDAQIREVIKGQTVRRFEERLTTPAGENRYLARSLMPLYDETGGVVRVLSYGTDITEQKRTEMRLLQANDAVALSAKAKEQFLANMSHEMRTPLNGVIGMAHLLQQSQPTAEQKQYLDALQFSADNLLLLINDILDFAKIETGHIQFEAIAFQPRTLIQQMLGTVQFKAIEKRLVVDVEVEEAVPRAVIGDPTRLSQILLNLIGNALKFTEHGGVVVTVGAQAAQIGTVLLRFEVADTGIGMAADVLPRIFDSFTQASSETTRKYGGTGLGLTIVKELIERQGGQIEVTSTLGRGSTFVVTLPFVLAEDETPANEAQQRQTYAEKDLTGVAILVVEDNEMNQMVARSLLQQWGVQVTIAENGRVAIECLRARAFDLVLMDIQMPEMDGYAATRYIRTQLGFDSETLPILALTASMLLDQKDTVFEAGMDDFILKPFNPAELKRRIASHLSGISKPQESPKQPVSPAPQATAAQYVNLALLEANAFGDYAFVTRIIDLFFEQVPTFQAGITQAMHAGDWAQVRFHAHKMKSSASMLGVADLEKALLAIEERIDQEHQHEGVPDLVESALCICDVALDELRIERKKYEGAS